MLISVQLDFVFSQKACFCQTQTKSLKQLHFSIKDNTKFYKNNKKQGHCSDPEIQDNLHNKSRGRIVSSQKFLFITLKHHLNINMFSL